MDGSIKVHVGAASRRVVEEAAIMRVPAIIASRRQVDIGGGYTGLDQKELVELVERLSDEMTQVVRDHGGPLSSTEPAADVVASFDADVEAGFDRLHIDVCNVPMDEQERTLQTLLMRYAGVHEGPTFEVGGEHDSQAHNERLLAVALDAGITPEYVVIDAGGYIWADRQRGFWRSPIDVQLMTERMHSLGVKVKCHNADWTDTYKAYVRSVDAVNIAPEFALVETQAWLQLLPTRESNWLLDYAYGSHAWTRWFNPDQGTWFERAVCAVRYVMEHDEVRERLGRFSDYEVAVRRRIRDAIAARG